MNECQLLSTLVPADRCFIRAELSFAHATLKTVPLITCEEVGDPLFSPSTSLPLPSSAEGSGKWGWTGGEGGGAVTHSQAQSVHHSVMEKLGGEERVGPGGEKKKEKKEISDPEVRGQGSSPDYKSVEELSARQAST